MKIQTSWMLLVVSLAVVGLSCSRSDSLYDYSWADQWIGERMAMEAARLANGKGEIVVLYLGRGKMKSVVADTQMHGFREGLKKFPNLKVMLESPTESDAQQFFIGMPEKLLFDSSRAHPQAKVVLSFLGLPVSSAKVERPEVSSLPKIVALHAEQSRRWVEMVDSGLITEVVLPRYDIQWDKIPAQIMKNRDSYFETFWVIATKTNLETVVRQRTTAAYKADEVAYERLLRKRQEK